MGTYVSDSRLFRDQFSTPRMREIFSDENCVQKWLDVEAGLAKVQARLGIIPADAAETIIATCKVQLLDLDAMKLEMDRTSHPIVPLLREMKKASPTPAMEWVHYGATTQDIMDTGVVLQVREGLDEIDAGMKALLAAACALAEKHRDLAMAGRSHGQQALPITFGFKAAGWAAEIARSMDRLAQMRERVLVGSFAGAIGTLAALGDKGAAVQDGLFEELGLANGLITWHTARDGMAELACTLGILAGTLGRIAHEIYELQKTEFSELEEPFNPGKVGSSTMPHKRNPPACEGIVALARAVRAIVPQAVECVIADHERDKIVLQSEREFTSRLMCMTHAAVMKTGFVLRGLTVRGDMMQRNLGALNGLLMSEPVMFTLGHKVGKQEAHEMVYEVCMHAFEHGIPLKTALLANNAIASALTEAEIDAVLDPNTYTGLSGYFVDRVLAGVKGKL